MHARLPFMLKLTLRMVFLFVLLSGSPGKFYFLWVSPVVSPMAKFLIVRNEQDPVPVTPIVAGPGLKPALKQRLAVVIEGLGGVVQYLNSRYKTAAHRRQLADQLIVFAPRRSNMTYLEVSGNTLDASVGCGHNSEWES